jgi:hypothetical protein
MLGQSSFAYCSSLCAVTFESGSRFTQIDGSAFRFCPSLRSLDLPASIQSIDGSAFDSDPITCVTIDSSNPYFCVSGDFLICLKGRCIVRYCGVKEDLMIGYSIESLGPGCFHGCSFLVSLSFERGSRLTRIGESAFSNWSRLMAVLIPASVELLGKECFLAPSLSELAFESGSALIRIDESAFRACLLLRSVCIPRSVTVLGESCFSTCHSLSTLTFESGSRVILIDEFAFNDCSSLKSVCVPASVELLGQSSFLFCRSLSALTFESHSKLTRINESAFSNCMSLRSVCLPASVQSIDGSAFLSTNRLLKSVDSNSPYFSFQTVS